MAKKSPSRSSALKSAATKSSVNTYPVPTSNPHLQLVIAFALTWIVSAVVISVASLWFPSNIVLGTATLSRWGALLLSSGVLAWLMTMSIALFTQIEINRQKVLNPKEWALGYFVLNVAAVWVISRFANELGLGVSSWLVVIMLAFILDMVQAFTMVTYGSMQKSVK